MQLKHQYEKKFGSMCTWTLADTAKASRNKIRIKLKNLSQGYSSYGVALTTHPQLAPNLLLIWAFISYCRVDFAV